MIIKIVKEVYLKTKKELDIIKSKYLLCCDKCKKEYESSIINREKHFKTYNSDLCRGCKQIIQYSSGKRNKQKEFLKNLSKNLKGKTYEDIFGKEKAIKLKINLSNKFSGKNNPMYGKNYQCSGLIRSANYQKGKTLEEIYGHEKAIEIKKKVSQPGKNNPMYGKPSPQGSGNGWSGWYNGHYFRSLLELSYMVYLDSNNINWITAEKLEFIIQYKDLNGIDKNYFPDFYLPDTDEIIEIKPKKLINTKLNKLKFEAANNKFKHFKVITEDNIQKISINEILSLVNSNKVKFIEKYNKKLKEYANGKKIN